MIWVELVCDQCSVQREGTTLGAFRKREYMAAAKRAGWRITRTGHLCPLCVHERDTGHRVHMGLGCITCGWPEAKT